MTLFVGGRGVATGPLRGRRPATAATAAEISLRSRGLRGPHDERCWAKVGN